MLEKAFTLAVDRTGMEFEIEDIRSLFKEEHIDPIKGYIPKIFHVRQNLGSHGGMLDLAQSVIGILERYFADASDIVKPETGVVHGEPPAFLEAVDDEDVIATIFGGTLADDIMILVRDDATKAEICKHRQHKNVYTLVESKGVHFKDVLMYDFFGSSPLKNKWKVIYGYMKEHKWLDEIEHHSYPSFDGSIHNGLCAELKKLYLTDLIASLQHQRN